VKKRTYGLSVQADVRAENIVVEPGAIRFELLTADQRRPVRLPVPGLHNVHNALAAAAAALELDVSLEDIVGGLEEFVPVQGRMNLFPLPSGGMLLDDSYNSNPLSARSALDALNALKGQGRKVAILGDMLELGEDAQVLHQALGERVAQVADMLIAVGQHGDHLESGALKGGMRKEQIYKVAHVAEAIELMKNCHRTGDRLLVKGSRGVQLDRLVQELKSAGSDSAQRKG
jgi:UDP-N-acetylmuramoyl-tripeptide--D-alanyl-D-alanine ligase